MSWPVGEVLPAPGGPYRPVPVDKSWGFVSDTAPHIRGIVHRPEVRRDGRLHYWFEVRNTITGQQLVHSDEFTFADAMTSCARVVAAARAAWFWSLDHNELEAGRAKTLKLNAKGMRTVMELIAGDQPDEKNLTTLVHRLSCALGSA